MVRLRKCAAWLLISCLCVSAWATPAPRQDEVVGPAEQAGSTGEAGTDDEVKAAKGRPLAVIVNLKNPTTNLSFRQLRSYFKLAEEYWPDRQRFKIYLRPPASEEQEFLLEKVYKMSKSELAKYWVGKINRGEISVRPSVASSAAAAVAQVTKVSGAITVVFASEVPKGVRVLTIDGKKPLDEGYPLVVLPKETATP